MTWPHSYVRRNELLSNHTSFRIGGPAEWFAEPSTQDELIRLLCDAKRLGMSVSIVGGGTNTLASDRGVRGLIIHLGSGFRTIRPLTSSQDQTVLLSCGAALLTQRLVSLAALEGWGDLESLAGLPGHLGGAITMNAQDIGRFVKHLTVVLPDGTLKQLSRESLHFRYRDSDLPPGIVTEVILEVPKIPIEEASERIRKAFNYRNTTQEIRLPSAGCAFRNPPGNRSAGCLIDQAGLKGTRIGDAQISFRHANFIVNLGQATCEDVLSLMEYVQQSVARRFQIRLEPEVRIMGQAFVER